MTAGDLGEVLAIESQSFPNPWTRGMFESELRNPVSSAYAVKIYRDNGFVVAAYIIYWIVYGEAHILNIAVHQDFRRQGLATALLDAAIDEMRRLLVYEVFLEVRRSNDAGRALYKGLGFREAFERKNYYGNEDAIVMVKDL
ncbi:MAG: ribosomal protein S18-alanine N-acetyltransferase [Deltaproteobacteria bacterium]|nr:ribosomal protein S18-alanine N-acetyltransferase [Deltaproteobacteria bacterium]